MVRANPKHMNAQMRIVAVVLLTVLLPSVAGADISKSETYQREVIETYEALTNFVRKASVVAVEASKCERLEKELTVRIKTIRNSSSHNTAPKQQAEEAVRFVFRFFTAVDSSIQETRVLTNVLIKPPKGYGGPFGFPEDELDLQQRQMLAAFYAARELVRTNANLHQSVIGIKRKHSETAMKCLVEVAIENREIKERIRDILATATQTDFSLSISNRLFR